VHRYLRARRNAAKVVVPRRGGLCNQHVARGWKIPHHLVSSRRREPGRIDPDVYVVPDNNSKSKTSPDLATGRKLAFVIAVHPAHTVTHDLSRALRLVHGRYKNGPLSAGVLAAELGLHPSYLKRLFRAALGCSLQRYIIRLRMQEGAELLRQGHKVDAVVPLVGYQCKKNFFRHFKQAFGATPAAYRETRRLCA
jgi:AraC-like DNA-binding protein